MALGTLQLLCSLEDSETLTDYVVSNYSAYVAAYADVVKEENNDFWAISTSLNSSSILMILFSIINLCI